MLRKGLMRPAPGSGGPQRVVNVTWRGLPYPSRWQVIGAFDLPPGNQAIALYPGPQRRNGVSDTTDRWTLNIAGLGAYNPAWVTQYPVVTPGSQRSARVAVQGPSRYKVFKMRQAVTAAQVMQSGSALIPFLQADQRAGPGA